MARKQGIDPKAPYTGPAKVRFALFIALGVFLAFGPWGKLPPSGRSFGLLSLLPVWLVGAILAVCGVVALVETYRAERKRRHTPETSPEVEAREAEGRRKTLKVWFVI